MTWTIRTRLTLWYGAAMMVALTVFSVGVLWLHARWGRAQFDGELANLAAAVSRVMEEELEESGNLQRAVVEARTSMDVPGRATAILDLDGTPVAAEWRDFSYNTVLLPPEVLTHPRFDTQLGGADEWRVLRRPESSAVGDYVILVAGPLEELGRQHALLLSVLLLATPVIVLATAAVSWLVASSALRPVTVMAEQAESITSRSADWRLNVPMVKDELGQLARAFNRLLGRLAAAAQTQRQFMADASHELRTPVSVIQTATEVTLQRQTRDEWEYRDALTIVHEQSTRLGLMVEDMLVLARADAGGRPLTSRPLYLDELVGECVRAVSVIAQVRNIQLGTVLQPDVFIHADDLLARQMVTNLLVNAVQHTPSGGTVTVALESDAAVATISVSDTGAGIAAADRERVFERFVRLDPARAATSGAGLGLPIARWIAEQHGGTVTLEENALGGCVFVVRLPVKRHASSTPVTAPWPEGRLRESTRT